jgi:hypothetical protein
MVMGRTGAACWATLPGIVNAGAVCAWTGTSPKTDTAAATTPAAIAIRAEKRLSKRIAQLLHSIRRKSQVW